jgi:hypothetical protein
MLAEVVCRMLALRKFPGQHAWKGFRRDAQAVLAQEFPVCQMYMSVIVESKPRSTHCLLPI